MTLKWKTGLSVLAGFTLASQLTYAQTPDAPDVARAKRPVASALRPATVHLGVLPLAWNGGYDVTGLSFSLFGDRVGRITGLQLSTLVNHTGGASSGLQLTGLGNLATDDFSGAQVAALANGTGGQARGLQLAGVFNGAQQGGKGVQMAGVSNLAGAAFIGWQVAGVLNVAGTVTGAQVGPANVAQTAQGAQVGVVNAASEVTGAQVGVINLASRGRGFSFGVINVAQEHDGEAFGLLTLVGDGIHNVAVYSTETMLSNVAVKLGTRHLYTSWMIGYHPGEATGGDDGRYSADSRRLGVGFGVGYRFDLGGRRLRFLELEANGITVGSKLDAFADDAPLLTAARVVVGVQLAQHLTLIAGISENVTVATGGRDLDVSRGGLDKVMRNGNTTVRMFPGLLLGVQL